MVDLSTNYLGLKLAHPIVPGACPLTWELDSIRELEDAGAPAIILRSLFEEQVRRDEASRHGGPVHPEHSPAAYLERIRRVKEAVRIPVIASLNGTSDIGWTGFARLMQEAGADALELNVYHVSSNLWTLGSAIEAQTLDMIRAVKLSVSIPVAVKIYPFFSSIVCFARQLDEMGIAGLVLFNRTYQPEIDLESRTVLAEVRLSSSSDLLPRLHWIAMLAGRLQLSLSATGGVHTAHDVLKAIFAGANTVQMVSALLTNGPNHLKAVHDEMERWLEDHGNASLDEVRGCMSLEKRPDENAFSFAASMHLLQHWQDAIVR
ncbi:MAG: dihydroorotate dehydrogenase-like protein [Thermoanaerobaculia bacterium]